MTNIDDIIDKQYKVLAILGEGGMGAVVKVERIKDNPFGPGLAYILQKATKENPDERFQKLGNLMDAIKGYRLSKDPSQHPRETFGNLVGEATALLSRKEYDSENIKKMVGILANSIPLDDRTVVDLFHTIPLDLLGIMARTLPDEALVSLQKYAGSIKEVVSSYNFEFAESVARRMKLIFQAVEPGRKPELKRAALLATLYAAVELNRFAAMDVFDELLVSVKDGGDAVVVADGLRENMDYYKRLATRIPADKLHPTIRDVQKEARGGETDSFQF
jgi:hypothetical protein